MSGVIDYDDLMAAYQADLVDTLRGFGAQSELLELWVPDEDPVRSLANMVDAAAAAGAERLSVRVGPATAPAIDRAALLALRVRHLLRTSPPGAGTDTAAADAAIRMLAG